MKDKQRNMKYDGNKYHYEKNPRNIIIKRWAEGRVEGKDGCELIKAELSLSA